MSIAQLILSSFLKRHSASLHGAWPPACRARGFQLPARRGQYRKERGVHWLAPMNPVAVLRRHLSLPLINAYARTGGVSRSSNFASLVLEELLYFRSKSNSNLRSFVEHVAQSDVLDRKELKRASLERNIGLSAKFLKARPCARHCRCIHLFRADPAAPLKRSI